MVNGDLFRTWKVQDPHLGLYVHHLIKSTLEVATASSFLNEGNQFHELKKNDQDLVSGER